MPLNPDAVGFESEPAEATWTSKDSLLYALGVGAGQTDPTGFELEFTTENSEGIDQQALPTMPVVINAGLVEGSVAVRGDRHLRLGDARARRAERHAAPGAAARGHGDDEEPGRRRCTTRARRRSSCFEYEATDSAGKPLFSTTMSAFIRGEGGWGGDRGPSGPRNVPPEREPDTSSRTTRVRDQALLYRLSGDRNPLHSDPSFAKLAGFDTPILHGLCTYGFTGPRAAARRLRQRSGSLQAHRRPVLHPGDPRRPTRREDLAARATRPSSRPGSATAS